MDWRRRLVDRRDLFILALLCLLPLPSYLALNWFVIAPFVLAGIASFVMGRGLRMIRFGVPITALALALSGLMMA